MDALLSAFVAAGLAEWGDKTQLLVAALAARHARPWPILAGIALAASVHAAAAAFGGIVVHDWVTIRALTLLTALALLFAGGAGLFPRKAPKLLIGARCGAFLASFACFFVAEFGDKTQFLTFSIAARFDSFAFAAAGAVAGVLTAALPALLLGARLTAVVPVRTLRLGAAASFLLFGCILALNALILV
ncbi:TMEM165/GDT1 family protein [Sphingosinicella sp. BN140058]|uniref:TMEM165/GDT1 family protein n=1 Tax=Sphingosinicella sp. BN140058 TaxID=1892855 RepID=UPI0013ECA8D6|nr:TMEM165/GDT1 family protein [Sphingosinicella sp. BN140058]